MAGLPEEGQPFGRYDITRRIGRGGMGVVYAAVQRGLGRDVALKVLSSDYADSEDYRHRFLREAEVLGRLDSPHVVSVHDSGEQDGWLYIAMQLVPDGDLHAKLKEFGPMPVRLALDVVAQVAEGIAAAHRAGIIHRDVKPSNVLLRQLGPEKVHAYVCDLGISRVLDSQHTRTQGVIGTFAYMAPERHEGHTATEASDIYALGCLLWASLTGAAPYTGTDSQVVLGHLHGAIPQLDRTDELGNGVNELLRRSMAKDPAGRHTDAAEFSGACRALVEVAQRAPAPETPDTGETVGADVLPLRGDRGQGEDLVQPGGPDEPPPGPEPAPEPEPEAVADPEPSRPGRSSRPGRRLLVAGIVLVAALALGGATAAFLLGGEDDPRPPGPTDPTGAAAAPRDATVREFCKAFRDFNFNPDYAEGRATIDDLVEVGTPAGLTGQQRDGFVTLVEVVQDSRTEDEFLTAFSALDGDDAEDVDAFQAYTRSKC